MAKHSNILVSFGILIFILDNEKKLVHFKKKFVFYFLF